MEAREHDNNGVITNNNHYNGSDEVYSDEWIVSMTRRKVIKNKPRYTVKFDKTWQSYLPQVYKQYVFTFS